MGRRKKRRRGKKKRCSQLLEANKRTLAPTARRALLMALLRGVPTREQSSKWTIACPILDWKALEISQWR